jgi:hypothetical protein
VSGDAKVTTRDYFAELYVAGLFAEAGWNVYFPHRDKGFDFIVEKDEGGRHQIRPVQVKGKYPTREKGDQNTYGYMGKLTATHSEMVLAISFFPSEWSHAPTCTAFLPFSLVRRVSRGYRCYPATFKNGLATPRRDFLRFFDRRGLELLDSPLWSTLTTR